MAGHSKWANIKYRKERQDAAKGKAFSRLSKEITIVARNEPDPAKNPTLAHAIERAKEANMPKENIERAIKRATGELPGMQFEEINYEGYGPFGVAVLVRVVTDNKNRAVSAIRKIFQDHGGNLEGSVAWLFERRGVIDFKLEDRDPDELLIAAIDLGAEEMEQSGEDVEITCAPEALGEVRAGLEALGVTVERAEASLVPKTKVPLEGKEAEKILRFVEALDEQEDVQEVFANFDVPDEAFAEVA